MHARRAASEIERAIRGVMKSKGWRSSGQPGQGRGIGFPWETEDGAAGWKQAHTQPQREK